MDHEGLGRDLELLAEHVAEAAGARRRVRILARVGLQRGQEFLVVLGREVRVDRDHVGDVGQVRDGLEVLDRVVRQLRIAGGVDRHRRHRRDADRVAVRRRLGDRVGADRAAATGAVLDHHRLAQDLAHLIGRAAADDVRGAARGKRNDQLDRLGRIVALCLCQRGAGGQTQGQGNVLGLHEIVSPVVKPDEECPSRTENAGQGPGRARHAGAMHRRPVSRRAGRASDRDRPGVRPGRCAARPGRNPRRGWACRAACH
ncbi:hypothetical protein OJJOAM_002615 [Cupriavidus sp. H18C1]